MRELTLKQKRAIAIARAKVKVGKTQTPAPQAAAPDWADVPGLAVSNFGSSAAQFGGDIYDMVTSPVETGESIYNLALGAAQKIIPDSWTDGPMGKEKYADAMADFFSQRYGGEDEIKRTLSTDPVGVLADFSAFVTGGGMLAAKGTSVAGKVARKAAETADKASASLVGNAAAKAGDAGRWPWGSRQGKTLSPTSKPDPTLTIPAMSNTANLAGQGFRALGSGLDATARGSRKVADAAQWLDPLYAASKLPPMAAALTGASRIPESSLGLTTGVGGDAVREAVKSGIDGGESGKSFRGNMRGSIKIKQLVKDARKGLKKIRSKRGKRYRSGMFDISKDKSILDFNQVDNALIEAVANNTFRGVAKSDATEAALKKIKGLIEGWKGLDPAEFHTPEGMDALKQRIGSLVDWKSNPKAENIAAQSMYDKVGSMIREQAPTYDKVMSEYAKKSDEITEIEKSLSLKKKSTIDQAGRALTGAMRNNVNTNYGSRVDAVKAVQKASGKPLMSAIAGQAMSSLTPRGLAGTAGLQTLLPLLAAGLSGSALPLLSLPLQSPRLVGEAVHAGGRAVNVAGKADSLLRKTGATPRGVLAAGYQANRAEEEEDELELRRKIAIEKARRAQGSKMQNALTGFIGAN